ncbi:MAG: nucleoside phosphorylase [Pseudomonadota bacterium]|nr:nucleoside phosphorylase [Pseudomonadota bacterium]
MSDVRSKTLLVLVGMKREARIVGEGAVIGAAGLAAAMARRPAGIVSFGLCGGLDPALKAGDLVVGTGVNGTPTDAAWANRLTAALPGAHRGDFTSGGAMAATPRDKAVLRRQTGAAAVDMESHALTGAGLPFAILRAVSDPAGRALPRAAQAGFKADGEIDVGAVLRALLARPAELPALFRTAREAGAAFRSLRDARHLLGPGLGCPYLVQHPIDMA